ncbi:hypothetical protein FRC07_011788, partial [Ceratobasidium sp. 392]
MPFWIQMAETQVALMKALYAEQSKRTIGARSSSLQATSTVKMSFEELDKHLTNKAMLDVNVGSLACYRDTKGVPHEYLVLSLNDSKHAWMRLERTGDARTGSQANRLERLPLIGPSITFAQDYAPLDTATLSAEKASLIYKAFKVKEELVFQRDQLPLWRLLHLLRAIRNTVSRYNIYD